ncbi:RNA-directed DNA polymerase from mobile element jockey [Caerostris extrusa]|uniref:RNA-directed DNA polymerase from mobile element jockey n=1 Tax=Caerostris extrusa TaxID=172846 RepID=A0AAV4NCQ7_CAEEX|nr:RNA-directed DNA polymerase from mobile element jockey [Caerostris extrusa]
MVELKLENTPPITFVSTCLKPQFTTSISLKKLIEANKNTIIAGDFNASHIAWNSPRNSHRGIVLNKFLKTRKDIKILAPHTHILALRLDMGITLQLHSNLATSNQRKITNWYNYNFTLHHTPIPLTEINTTEDAEHALEKFTHTISDALDKTCRPHFGQPGKKLHTYIRNNITNRNKIRKAGQRSKDPALKNSISKLTTIIKKEIKIFNSNNWSNFTANLSDNSTSLWRKVAALRNNATTIPPLTSDTGTTAISPVEKAELIADCWRTQFSPNPNQNHVSTDTLII